MESINITKTITIFPNDKSGFALRISQQVMEIAGWRNGDKIRLTVIPGENKVIAEKDKE